MGGVSPESDGMPAPIVERIVAFSARYPGLVLAIALLLGVLAGVYSATHFAMNTDPAALISAQTTWRKRDAIYDANFPQFNNTIDIVIDGATPETAERGTAALYAAMSSRRDLFLSVRRPDNFLPWDSPWHDRGLSAGGRGPGHCPRR